MAFGSMVTDRELGAGRVEASGATAAVTAATESSEGSLRAIGQSTIENPQQALQDQWFAASCSDQTESMILSCSHERIARHN